MGFTGIYIPDEKLNMVVDYETAYKYYIDMSYCTDMSYSNEMKTEYMSLNNILFTNAYYRIDNIFLYEEESVNYHSITNEIEYDMSFNVVDVSSTLPIEHINSINVILDDKLNIVDASHSEGHNVFGVKNLIEIQVNIYDKYYNFSQDKILKINRDHKGILIFHKKLDKSSINNLWKECYDYIKPIIINDLDNKIKNYELFKCLDLSATLIDN